MRFLFKTDYEDDIRLFPHSGYVVSYGLLIAVLLIAPYVLSSYLMSQLVFVCIYATVGVALLILTGFTGQASLAMPHSLRLAPTPRLTCRNTTCRSRSISSPPGF